MTYDDHVECDKSYQEVCDERDKVLDLLRESVDHLYKVKGYLDWELRRGINKLLDRIKETKILEGK